LRRKLYTDGELAVFSFRRVVLLTSIDPGALRGDLGDRVLLVDLEPIDESARLTRRGIDARYQAARPRMFGALLDLLAGVWRELPYVHLEKMPRMADFAQLVAAMDRAHGTNGLRTYIGQRERIAETVIESDAVALSIVALVEADGAWEGTAGELLARLTPEKQPKDWPRTPRALSARVTRLIPALKEAGIAATFGPRRRHGRIIMLAQKGAQPIVTTDTPPLMPLGDGGDGRLHAPSNGQLAARPTRLRGLCNGRLDNVLNT
jgi:hypothetical protein